MIVQLEGVVSTEFPEHNDSVYIHGYKSGGEDGIRSELRAVFPVIGE